MLDQSPRSPDKPQKYGDPADWAIRYGDVLFRVAVRRGVSREQAEDLVQETFLLAYRHRDRFEGKSSFGTWLVSILRRRVIDAHRKTGRTADNEAESVEAIEGQFTSKNKWRHRYSNWQQTPRELAETAEFWRVFQSCMSELPHHLAQAFQLRELDVQSVDDASRFNGVTPKNLAVRLHRARLLLRDCLEKNWFRAGQRDAT